MYASDISSVNSQYVGEDLKYGRLRNTLTQPDFLLNSQGQTYGELVSAALTASIERNIQLDLTYQMDN